MKNRKREIAWFLLWLSVIGIGWMHLHSTVLQGLSRCLLRDLTGLLCPLCGGTRAMQALLAFDFTGAVQMNALVFLFVPLAGSIGLFLLVPVFGKRSLIKNRSALVITLWSILGLVLIFTIVRNIIW